LTEQTTVTELSTRCARLTSEASAAVDREHMSLLKMATLSTTLEATRLRAEAAESKVQSLLHSERELHHVTVESEVAIETLKARLLLAEVLLHKFILSPHSCTQLHLCIGRTTGTAEGAVCSGGGAGATVYVISRARGAM
jgi:hypothetical protein